MLAKEILERNGYRVVAAGTPVEAIEVARRKTRHIHLLLTDVVMPGMSGRHLADRLTAADPSLKVLYMSGYAGDVAIQQGIFESGSAFLQKPLTPDALCRTVRELLDGRTR